MKEVVVHEDELKSVDRKGVIVHAGVTSCLTITAILAKEIVGLHIVQWMGEPPNDTSYLQRLPALIKRFNQRVHGRPIQHLILVWPADYYQETAGDIRGKITGADVASFSSVDIGRVCEIGNDVYMIGYADMVRVVAAGKTHYMKKFNVIGDNVVV